MKIEDEVFCAKCHYFVMDEDKELLKPCPKCGAEFANGGFMYAMWGKIDLWGRLEQNKDGTWGFPTTYKPGMGFLITDHTFHTEEDARAWARYNVVVTNDKEWG